MWGLKMSEEGNGMNRRKALMASVLITVGNILPANQAGAAGLALGYGVSEKGLNEQVTAYGLAPFDKARFPAR